MLTRDVLSLEFYSHDLDRTISVKGYFKEQLKTLWSEGTEQLGKRPFMEIFLYHKLIDNAEDYDGHDRIVAKCLEAL